MYAFFKILDPIFEPDTIERSVPEETIDDDNEPSIFDEIEPNGNEDDPGDPEFVVSSPPTSENEDDDSNDKNGDRELEKDEKKNEVMNTNKFSENEVMNNFTAPQPIKDELGYKCPLCPRTALTKCSSHGHILRAHFSKPD